MTLHEAIEKLLREEGRSMTTAEITAALNARGWFKKKDGSAICKFLQHIFIEPISFSNRLTIRLHNGAIILTSHSFS